MSFWFLIKLSIRNLFRHYRRTLLLISAIVVAIAGVVVLNALLRGMQTDIRDQVISNLTGHLKIHKADYFDNPSVQKGFVTPIDWIERFPEGRAVGWAGRIRVPATIMSERETRGIELIGVDPAQEVISFLDKVEIKGDFLKDSADPRLVIGQALARQLETAVGKRVVIISQGYDGLTREMGFRVAGVYEGESETAEKQFVFSSVQRVQDFLETDVWTEISIKLFSDDFEEIKGYLTTVFSDLKVSDWQELEPQMATMYLYVDFGVYILFVIIMGTLAFGLVNAFVTSVMEREREFGMVRALGMSGRAVVLQVVLESMLITICGLLSGILIGVVITHSIGEGIDLSQWSDGVRAIGMSATLYPRVVSADIYLVIWLTLVFSLFSSVYPARKAIKIRALEAMGR